MDGPFAYGLGCDVNLDRDVGLQSVSPRKLAGQAIQFFQMKHAELADTREDAGGPAQQQIRAPNGGPMAHEGHAAICDLSVFEASLNRFGLKGGFHPRDSDGEDFKWFHGASLSRMILEGEGERSGQGWGLGLYGCA